jgi:hypothetical protein
VPGYCASYKSALHSALLLFSEELLLLFVAIARANDGGCNKKDEAKTTEREGTVDDSHTRATKNELVG